MFFCCCHSIFTFSLNVSQLENARDFRNDFDVDNPSKMSLFSVFFHSVLCCSGMSDHLLFKRMFFGRSAGRRRQYIEAAG